MRIEFTQSGGIVYAPGLQRPVVIDTAVLSTEDRQLLEGLVESTRFFDLPGSLGAPAKGAADYQTGVLTIEDGGRRHTVRVVAPAQDAALRELLREVQKQVKAARRQAREAGGPGS